MSYENQGVTTRGCGLYLVATVVMALVVSWVLSVFGVEVGWGWIWAGELVLTVMVGLG